MPDIINLPELVDSTRLNDTSSEKGFRSYICMELIGADFQKIFPDLPSRENCEFDLKINGVSVSFTKIVEILRQEFDACVTEKARDLILLKFQDTVDRMEDLKQAMDREIKEKFPSNSDSW